MRVLASIQFSQFYFTVKKQQAEQRMQCLFYIILLFVTLCWRRATEYMVCTPSYFSVHHIMHSSTQLTPSKIQPPGWGNEINGTYNITFAFEIYTTKYVIM